jgi:tRNA A37 N6-isopentenylltransferase MiaA
MSWPIRALCRRVAHPCAAWRVTPRAYKRVSRIRNILVKLGRPLSALGSSARSTSYDLRPFAYVLGQVRVAHVKHS